MGQIKQQIAIPVAYMIYHLKLEDEAIVASLKSQFPAASTEWIKDQVKAVRENPNIYKEMH